jgi:LPXTG-motif cell wall-anchored protein
MYNPCSAGSVLSAGGVCVLPATGASVSIIWLVLAAFALLTVGGSLLRTAPSLHRHPSAPRPAAAGIPVRTGRRRL